MNLLLWINQSNGDTLGCIPIVEAIKKQFPEVNVKFACFHDQSYLMKHLPIEVISAPGNYKNLVMRHNPNYFLRPIKHLISENDILIHMSGGTYGYRYTWQNYVKIFNRHCQEKNINLVLDDSEFGFIELPIFDVDVKENAVYVESCQPISGQTCFQFDMFKLGLMFPNINFYSVGSIDFQSKNVHDCSKLSLIELSSISRKCKLILGKGSSPFCCTFNKENKDKPKAVFGLMGEWRFKYWNETDESILLLDSEEEMYELLRPINRGR